MEYVVIGLVILAIIAFLSRDLSEETQRKWRADADKRRIELEKSDAAYLERLQVGDIEPWQQS